MLPPPTGKLRRHFPSKKDIGHPFRVWYESSAYIRFNIATVTYWKAAMLLDTSEKDTGDPFPALYEPSAYTGFDNVTPTTESGPSEMKLLTRELAEDGSEAIVQHCMIAIAREYGDSGSVTALTRGTGNGHLLASTGNVFQALRSSYALPGNRCGTEWLLGRQRTRTRQNVDRTRAFFNFILKEIRMLRTAARVTARRFCELAHRQRVAEGYLVSSEQRRWAIRANELFSTWRRPRERLRCSLPRTTLSVSRSAPHNADGAPPASVDLTSRTRARCADGPTSLLSVAHRLLLGGTTHSDTTAVSRSAQTRDPKTRFRLEHCLFATGDGLGLYARVLFSRIACFYCRGRLIHCSAVDELTSSLKNRRSAHVYTSGMCGMLKECLAESCGFRGGTIRALQNSPTSVFPENRVCAVGEGVYHEYSFVRSGRPPTLQGALIVRHTPARHCTSMRSGESPSTPRARHVRSSFRAFPLRCVGGEFHHFGLQPKQGRGEKGNGKSRRSLCGGQRQKALVACVKKKRIWAPCVTANCTET
ncbi:unnamed protein product [Rangifer tarandus platyrhynchus]|uniref:Uncharacterized protein n=1 Tax=Rangifer tarandus platyrhynchus TaxID=3082113 RepID=A0ABN8XI61_RANTA|nr:unnamed protein product [Rangifer tarandus platyrhynchus]